MRFLDSLAPLGVRRAVLTASDGLVIESIGSGAPSAELLAAELASLHRNMRRLAEGMGGGVRRFTLATEEREVLVVVVRDYCLGAVVERSGDRRAVGAELSRLASRLSEQL
ncbi:MULTISPECIES: roadblock/LC7 domain-containing protein [unclassified Meiothermus]|uniref:roadblock/LC7 domain-containing protein n=1 Tax=unclassified Meiothermus TaxID=370471 RepID=UPI000D7CB6D2|nr:MULTISPECIES: roadblock/LC7 domain-containing protein [unclassified Meiothermus]PZA08709.1 roadblock/LC7 domain-containing protein [Meiothermus sp. Pnk-1]RYM40671.1 roadblock/LC7 domain-containing protein [Meiothermus sp. PNK-Is4]